MRVPCSSAVFTLNSESTEAVLLFTKLSILASVNIKIYNYLSKQQVAQLKKNYDIYPLSQDLCVTLLKSAYPYGHQVKSPPRPPPKKKLLWLWACLTQGRLPVTSSQTWLHWQYWSQHTSSPRHLKGNMNLKGLPSADRSNGIFSFCFVVFTKLTQPSVKIAPGNTAIILSSLLFSAFNKLMRY